MSPTKANGDAAGRATAEEVAAARHDPKLANVLYHAWEAGTYDEKSSISFEVGFEIDVRIADAESIPYPDGSFDLVVGHAVLSRVAPADLFYNVEITGAKPRSGGAAA